MVVAPAVEISFEQNTKGYDESMFSVRQPAFFPRQTNTLRALRLITTGGLIGSITTLYTRIAGPIIADRKTPITTASTPRGVSRVRREGRKVIAPRSI
ncbi:hypothetical protein CBM2609_B90003 [Cupriavidus taiwanensis]|nr:hypothetical protein CBM2604_B80003 [Cupriavidus taiwanensis]SOZ33528.1 hypothetical protein CBM2609_B90003 [Cupriavidus taiwanensis]SOZ48802.1 hypothetical protein CBM2610_B70003 [Cupriavidus taiwanensis]